MKYSQYLLLGYIFPSLILGFLFIMIVHKNEIVKRGNAFHVGI